MTESEFASMKKADDLSAWEVVLIAEVERLRREVEQLKKELSTHER